jgi:hypothetical protein
MNRQIKFRGQRTDGEGWVYGYYFTAPLTAEYNVLPENGAFFDCGRDTRRHVIADENGCVFEVIPETVGMYSGFTARYGEEICEGDILCLVAGNGRKINVICRFGSAHRTMKDTGALCDIVGFYFEHANEAKSFPVVCNYAGLHDTKIMKVIGNIHDDKELLTTK